MSQAPNPYNPDSYNPSQARGPIPLDSQGESTALAVSTFFNAVYAWMCAGLALTATVAWYVSHNTGIVATLGMPGMVVLFLAEIALVVAIGRAMNRISAGVATMLFLLFAALNGVSLSGFLLLFSHAVLGGAFAITAGMFGAMSLYGFITKRDLSGWGSLLFMGLIGLILASVVSFFVASTLLTALINYVGVLIFVGLTAYHTQMLKDLAIQTSGDAALAARLSVTGALALYLDFINLFLQIASILGNRR